MSKKIKLNVYLYFREAALNVRNSLAKMKEFKFNLTTNKNHDSLPIW
jgi:hypothetical protein